MCTKEIRLLKGICKTLLATVALVATFSRCASMQAPQGGPRDSIPPKVVAMTPAYGTTNFNGRQVYIEFDEYVQLKDQQKQFFTSPFMGKKPVLSIKKKGILVTFQEPLDSNRTYALNFGSSVADNNEGNPLNGFRYVFSTGSEVDSLLMSGMTLDARTGDTVGNTFILFYDAALDSVPEYDSTVFNSKPEVVGRAYPNGIFFTENLKPKPYRVYALDDRNGNLTYEAGIDAIGFLDSVYNPLAMDPFSIGYDTLRRYMAADPQLLFNMFLDQRQLRQNLTTSSRPQKEKLIFQFAAPYPRIDSLVFYNVDTAQIITEYLKPQRDSIAFWLTMPQDEIPDTVKGRIVYQRTDSTGALVPYAQDIRLGWYERVPQRRRERDAEKEQEEKPLTFRVNTSLSGGSLIPEDSIRLIFDYPLLRLDTAAVRLEKIDEKEQAVPFPFRLNRDTLKIREYTLTADWAPDDRFRLVIPAGAMEDIRRQANDSLRTEFTMEHPDKYAIIVLDVKGKTPEAQYIIQIVDEKGTRIIKEHKGVTTGRHELRYIPAGVVRIRIIEDLNGNGKWDAGSLVDRRQSERVEMFVGVDGREEITTKTNWDIEFTLDMNEIFAPVTPERMQAKIARDNARVLRKREQERAEAAQSSNRNRNQNQNQGQSSGMGIGGSMPFGSGQRSFNP